MKVSSPQVVPCQRSRTIGNLLELDQKSASRFLSNTFSKPLIGIGKFLLALEMRSTLLQCGALRLVNIWKATGYVQSVLFDCSLL